MKKEEGCVTMDLATLWQHLQGDASAPRLHAPGADPARILVTSVEHDSRLVGPGSLFACVPGGKRDGHVFAEDARRRGASALLVDHLLDLEIPQILVPDVRRFMGRAAAALHRFPSDKLTLVALTGTNGKSTTTYMLRSVLQAAGTRTGLLGTIVYHDGCEEIEADRTTPENTQIQSLLARMVDNRCEACVMETSSHGLEQGRLEGCRFDRGGFTNLSPEHLDYHGTLEAYFEAKELLFRRYMKPRWAGAANRKDPFGQRLLDAFPSELVGYASGQPRSGDWGAVLRTSSLEGMVLDLVQPDGVALEQLRLPLLGTYNVENALACAALAGTLGVGGDALRRGLESMPQVPGRLERYALPGGVTCVIDYAHTPEGLEKVLSTLRTVCEGNLWSVFGHGGERTVGHRPLLGLHAGTLADRVVVTMDNPRSEDPAAIASQIEEGLRRAGKAAWDIRLPRGEAIRYALDRAKPGDVVVVTGKGPERQILFADHAIPFEDREAVLAWAEDRFPGYAGNRETGSHEA